MKNPLLPRVLRCRNAPRTGCSSKTQPGLSFQLLSSGRVMLIYCDLSPLKSPGKEQISTPVPRQAALSLSRALVLRGWAWPFPSRLSFSGSQRCSGAHGAVGCGELLLMMLLPADPGCSAVLASTQVFPIIEALEVWISYFKSACLSAVDWWGLLHHWAMSGHVLPGSYRCSIVSCRFRQRAAAEHRGANRAEQNGLCGFVFSPLTFKT